MQLNYKEIAHFSDQSKIWLYQSDRLFTETEKDWLKEELKSFASSWAAHGKALSASAIVFSDYHLLFIVDETKAGASGCSIDSSVRFVKLIGTELKVDFFNRLNILVEKENHYFFSPFSELEKYSGNNFVNLLITTKNELPINFWKEIS